MNYFDLLCILYVMENHIINHIINYFDLSMYSVCEGESYNKKRARK